MEEKNAPDIPYIAHEGEVARLERTIKRLTQIIILCIALIFATNAIWLYYWNQYEYVDEDTTYTYDQNGLGVNIIGANNEVTNEPETNDKTQSSESEKEERK